MRDNQQYPTIPENADKLLFAEDFVNHILKRLHIFYQYRSGITAHRDDVYNAFNPRVREAANYAFDHHAMNDDWDYTVKNLCDEPIEIADFLYFSKPLTRDVSVKPTKVEGAQQLMDTCVQISALAGAFYKHGLLEAPECAVKLIVSLIKTDMAEGGWKMLNRVAKYYRSPSVAVSVSSSSEESSGEGQGSHSEESSDGIMYFSDVDSSSEEVSVRSDFKKNEKTCGEDGNIVNSSHNASNSFLPGWSGEKNSRAPSWDTSSDEESKQNIPNKKPKLEACSNSKEFSSGSKSCERDLSTVDYVDPSSKQLDEKHLAIFVILAILILALLISSTNKPHKFN